MAEKEGGATKAAPPPPRLALPPRPSGESIFRGGANSGLSPGPMTLVSSFFAEEPESDCRSFLQLLAGAMGSPVPTLSRAKSEEVEERIEVGGDARSDRSLFLLPQMSSPNCLADSPTFFTPQGAFGISHQQALAQVTAQALHAAQAQGTVHPSSDHPSSAVAATGEGPAAPLESTHLSGDGYNWRKYGQKKVKCSEFPRSYYKCTYPNCQVKKKVEKSLEGHVLEITYKGQHIHSPLSSSKRSKSGGADTGPPQDSSIIKNDRFEGDNLLIIEDEVERKSTPGQMVEQLSCLSDAEDMDETDVRIENGKESKKRKPEVKGGGNTNKEPAPMEPKIIVQTTSEVDLLDDGFRWRKYGQKVVKGNPNPRSYYKCTSAGCNARKHIERSSVDPKVVITSYERKHNHSVPGARSAGHNLFVTDSSAATL